MNIKSTKSDLLKEINRLKIKNEELEYSKNLHREEIEDVHSSFNNIIEGMNKDFEIHNDFVLCKSLMNKNNDLSNKIERLEDKLNWYEEKKGTSADLEIRKLEKIIVQLTARLLK